MAINNLDSSYYQLLFQGQNASANSTWGSDQEGSDLNGKLTLWLERRLNHVDKQIQQGQASGQLSSEEAQKLEDLEKKIQDKLATIQQSQTDASDQDLQDLRQMMGQLNQELSKALPEGHFHHALGALGTVAVSQTTVGVDSTSQTTTQGQSQSVDIYA